MNTEKTIVLIGDPRTEESLAAAAITPGDLIALASTGKVARHAVAGGWAEPLFAKEDALQGKEISEDYAADDIVNYAVCRPGDVINVRIAAATDVTLGAALQSAGNGTLTPYTNGVRIAVALEAVAADSGDPVVRIRARIV